MSVCLSVLSVFTRKTLEQNILANENHINCMYIWVEVFHVVDIDTFTQIYM